MKKRSLALPLYRVNFGDSSQVVELFTQEHGLVRGLAKGAHREGRSPFQGPFDLGTLVEVVYIEKEGLSIITEKVVCEGFAGLRKSYRAFLGGLGVLDYLRTVAREGDALPDLFRLSVECLGEMASQKDPAAALILYGVQALRLLGWFPRTDRCVRCGADPLRSGTVRFGAPSGGVLCVRCGRPGDRVVPAGALKVIESLGRTWPPPWGRVAIPRALYGGIRAVLVETTVFQLEREPKMLQYLGDQL